MSGCGVSRIAEQRVTAVVRAEYASSYFSEDLSITLPTADQSVTPGALPLYIGSPIVADGGSYAYRGDLFAYDQSTGLLSTLSSISASLAGTAKRRPQPSRRAAAEPGPAPG